MATARTAAAASSAPSTRAYSARSRASSAVAPDARHDAVPAARDRRRRNADGDRVPGARSGLLSSLTAVGIVLIYRSHRIINFAQAALGVAGGVFTRRISRHCSDGTTSSRSLPGLLVAAGLGLIFQLVFVIRFFNAPRLVVDHPDDRGGPGDPSATDSSMRLPIFPPVEDRTQEQFFGQAHRPPVRRLRVQARDRSRRSSGSRTSSRSEWPCSPDRA